MALSGPGPLVATTISPTSILLTWTNNGQYDWIYVERESPIDGGSVEIAHFDASEEEYADIGLDPNTEYNYQVRGYRFSPEEWSPYSNEDDATTYDNLQAPSELEVIVFSDCIELTFKDNSASEDVFEIWRRDGGGYAKIDEVARNVDFFRDTTVVAGTLYYYKVRGRQDPSDYSDYTSEQSGTANNIPNAPTGPTLSGITDEEMRFSWTAPAAGFEVTGYRIEKSANGDFTGEEEEIAVVDSDVFEYLVKGLSADTPYWFRVRAYNGKGNGAFSGEATDTTLAQYVRSDFEVFVRDPNIKPVYIAEVNPKMTFEGFPFMKDDNLVCCLPMDETSGMVANDKSGNGNDGALINMEEEDHMPGKVNNGLIVDGVNEHVSVPVALNQSYCVWFNVLEDQDEYASILSTYSYSGDRSGFRLRPRGTTLQLLLKLFPADEV